MFEGENKREKILVLLTMCFALFMAMLDNTVVNVAVPTIARDLHAGISELQWIIDGYVLAFASLLLTGGILGDRYGRKRMFMSGLAVFTLASLGCGMSSATETLIAFRVLQGVGAALLMPGTLSILTVTFPPQERAKAIGIWAGVSGIALALGPTGGGWLVQHVSWESVFFLNVPIGIVGFLIAARVVTESRSEETRRLDIPGLALGSAALFSATFGLIEANDKGWTSATILAALGLAAVLLACFLVWETKSDHAMMPLRFFRIPAFSAGNHVAFSVSLGMFGVFLFISLYMQNIRGYSPFAAGLAFLPMTAMIIFVAPNAGKIAQKRGSRMPMTAGLLMSATGLALLSFIGADTHYLLLLPIFVLMGSGMGMTMTPMTAAVMNAVGPERAGLGSAMTNTSREVGGVLGIALLGTILTTKLKSSFTVALTAIAGLPAAQAQALAADAGHGRLGAEVVGTLAPEQQAAIFHAYQTSFMSGFHLALLFGSAVLFSAAFVAHRYVPSGAPQRDAHHPSADQPTEAMAH